MPDDTAKWVSISAAARALGISRPAVRGRIKRGTLETRQKVAGNRSVLQVRLPEGLREGSREPAPERLRDRFQEPPPGAVEAELRARVAHLEGEVVDLRAERERLLMIIERLTAERTPPPRGPWPGLRSWWRRFWTGEGGP